MKIRAIATLLFILFSISAFGQGRAKISGYIRDADGNPLDLVNIRVKNTLNGTMSNEKGHYSLSVATGDSVTLIYSCLGYNKAERILPQVTKDMRLNVQMNYTSLELGEVVATAIRKQTTTLETLNADRVKLLPDPAGGSIESLVVTFAGVTSNNELSSQYSVRGGSYDENIVYVNGLEVFRPLLIRSGQQEGLSFINPDMTEAVNFSAGGFEARYGDKMSSVLDITYKKPKGFEGSASASLLGANAYVGSSSGKFTQVTGFRYKTGRSLLKTTDTDAEYDPNFIDLQTYMTYQLAPKWEINFLGNLAINNYKFIPHTRETSFGTATNAKKFKVFMSGQERDKFETLFGALTLKHNLNDNTELGLQASAFTSKEEEGYDIAGDYWLGDAAEEGGGEIQNLSIARYNEHARNRLHSNIMNVGHYGVARIKNNTLKWGATVQLEKINDKISEWEKRDSAGYSLPQGGGNVNVIANLFSDNKLESTRISGYLQDVFKFRTKQGLFTLVGGVRGSYWSYNREFIFSPRASIGFIPNFDQNLTFRLASGLYYQSPFYKELRTTVQDEYGNSIIQLNKNLKSQRSIHVIAGGDYTFRASGRNFKVSADMYYKKLDNLNPYTVDNVKIRYYGENCAQGHAMGLDVKFFGEFVPGTDSWISFSLMKAEQSIRGSEYVPMPNSQGYNVSLFFQDYFPGYKRVKLNLKGVLSGGLPFIAPRTKYEDVKSTFRTPAYKRVDLGFSYQLAGGTDAIMDRGVFRHLKNIWIGVDVFNLFDIKNVSSYYWITNIDNQQYAVPNYLTGRQLNARLIVDF